MRWLRINRKHHRWGTSRTSPYAISSKDSTSPSWTCAFEQNEIVFNIANEPFQSDLLRLCPNGRCQKKKFLLCQKSPCRFLQTLFRYAHNALPTKSWSVKNKMSNIRTPYFLNLSTNCETSSTDSSSRPVTSTFLLSVMPKR